MLKISSLSLGLRKRFGLVITYTRKGEKGGNRFFWKKNKVKN